jgi:hypothetical protein
VKRLWQQKEEAEGDTTARRAVRRHVGQEDRWHAGNVDGQVGLLVSNNATVRNYGDRACKIM